MYGLIYNDEENLIIIRSHLVSCKKENDQEIKHKEKLNEYKVIILKEQI